LKILDGEISIQMPAPNSIIAQSNWPENFNNGLVLYASSANPIKKPMVEQSKTAKCFLLIKSLPLAGKMAKMANENKNNIKNEMPPNAGLLVDAHLIIGSSLFCELRIPKLFENFTNKPLIKVDSKTATKKSMKT
jgi:hypothetical protein